jgi:N-carbamoylputrescine amidase
MVEGTARKQGGWCTVIVSMLTAGSIAADDAVAAKWDAEKKLGARVVRIAVCQIFCIDGDAEGNLRRIEYAAATAAAENADLASFPESAILGWANPEAHRLAEPIPGPMTQRLGELARNHHLMICIGMDEKDGEKLYDSAVLIGADGTLLLKQRKIDNLNRLNLMNPPYADGRRGDVRTVDTPLGRIGIVICADSFNEAIVREIGQSSPELLLAPFGWAAETRRWPRHGQILARLVARTAEWSKCPVVGTNRVGRITHGPWAGRIYGGQSVAVDREGKLLGVLRDRDAEVRVFDVRIGNRGEDEQGAAHGVSTGAPLSVAPLRLASDSSENDGPAAANGSSRLQSDHIDSRRNPIAAGIDGAPGDGLGPAGSFAVQQADDLAPRRVVDAAAHPGRCRVVVGPDERPGERIGRLQPQLERDGRRSP